PSDPMAVGDMAISARRASEGPRWRVGLKWPYRPRRHGDAGVRLRSEHAGLDTSGGREVRPFPGGTGSPHKGQSILRSGDGFFLSAGDGRRRRLFIGERRFEKRLQVGAFGDPKDALAHPLDDALGNESPRAVEDVVDLVVVRVGV